MKRKRSGSTSEQNRKQRNCAAQKAYRQRQNLYVKELEEKLQGVSKSDADRFSELQDTVVQYRQQLLDAHKKLESTRISLQGVLDNVAAILGMNTKKNHCNCSQNAISLDHSEAVLPQPPTDHTDGLCNVAPLTDQAVYTETDFEHQTADLSIHPPGFGMYEGGMASTPSMRLTSKDTGNDHTFSFHFDASYNLENTLSNPNSSSFPSALGFSPLMSPVSPQNNLGSFRTALKNANLDDPCEVGTYHSNSPFSDHLSLFQKLMQDQLRQCQVSGSESQILLQETACLLVSTFTQRCWSPLVAFMANTKASMPVAKVCAWLADPSPQTHDNLDGHYRPTALQLAVRHPAVIDWVPFPLLRDRLILYHANDPVLDDIICEIADSYCCEIELSELVAGYPKPCWGFVRIRDLTDVITSSSIGDDDLRSSATAGANRGSGHNTLPAPSAAKLFASETLAKQAFYLMGMDKGLGTVSLDPRFFEQHPQLYDPRIRPNIAKGVALRPPAGICTMPVPKPKAVDNGIANTYREIITWSFQASMINASRLRHIDIENIIR